MEIEPEAIGSKDGDRFMFNMEKINLTRLDKIEVIKAAANEFALVKYKQSLDAFYLKTFIFDYYGRKFIENVQCDPESWIHVAIHFALRQFRTKDQEYYEYGGLTDEVLDYFDDPFSEEKLRLAIESHQFYRYLQENGYNVENIMQTYNEIVNENTSSFDENVTIIFKKLLNNPLIKHIEKSVVYSKQIEIESNYFGLIHISGLPMNSLVCDYRFLENGAIQFVVGCCQNQELKFVDNLCQTLVQMKSCIN